MTPIWSFNTTIQPVEIRCVVRTPKQSRGLSVGNQPPLDPDKTLTHIQEWGLCAWFWP